MPLHANLHLDGQRVDDVLPEGGGWSLQPTGQKASPALWVSSLLTKH